MQESNQQSNSTDKSLYDLISATVESGSEIAIQLAVKAIQAKYVPREEVEGLLLGDGAPSNKWHSKEDCSIKHCFCGSREFNGANAAWRKHIHNVLKGE